MLEFPSSSDEQQLADHLRRAAQETQPPFSDARHDRIMQAVRASQGDRLAPASTAPRSVSYGKYAVALSLTAVCLLAIGLATWRLRPSTIPSDVANTTQHDKASSQDALRIDDIFDDALSIDLGASLQVPITAAGEPFRQEWQLLNDDAQIALSLVTDTLPVNLFPGE